MNGAVTQVRTPEPELVERLAHQLQLSPNTARALLHSTIEKLPHLLPDPTFELLAGSGKNATTLVWTNPALVTPPSTLTKTQKYRRQTEAHHSQIAVVCYSPEHAERVDIPWDFTSEEGLTLNGQRMPLKPSTVKLLAAMQSGTGLVHAGHTEWLFMTEICGLYVKSTEFTEERFKSFVAWANWSFDMLNQMAPIILINNSYRTQIRRDPATVYSFNHAGDWASWFRFPKSLFPIEAPADFSVFEEPVTFLDPPVPAPPPARIRRRTQRAE